MSTDRKVFLVTGASSGVGRSVAEHFAKGEKNLVYAAARGADALLVLQR